MLSKLPYACFADFRPYPKTDVERKSKAICGQVKRPNEPLIRQAVTQWFKGEEFQLLTEFLNPQSVLVPIPRSAPLVDGAVWPPLTIAEILVEHGFGERVYPCLKRIKAIRKSALQSGADTRPLVPEHYETFAVEPPELLDNPINITLVDDVVTAGRTAVAAALRIQEIFPDATTRLFAMMRTQSFNPVEKIRTYGTGIIQFYPDSGKTFRDP